MLLARINTWMIKKRLGKIGYHFAEFPRLTYSGQYGIYINIPFCYSRCSFCPFYKELYQEDLKNRYVAELTEEIRRADISGRPAFIYFGGGTPNVLSEADLSGIVAALRQKVTISDMGIELSPALLTTGYFQQLHGLGFSKVSIGIQSFSPAVTHAVCRSGNPFEHIRDLVSCAQESGLRVNIDLLFGLPSQSRDIIIRDFDILMQIRPEQISLYPLVVSKGHTIPFEPSLSAEEQLSLIEEAASHFSGCGYARKTIWVFARGDAEIYDTSGSEIDSDYRGFGAGAYTMCGGVRVMNPDVYSYIAGIENKKPYAFVATAKKQNDEMRHFAKMLYSQFIAGKNSRSPAVRMLTTVLEARGYTRQGHLTRKGKLFAHMVSKTVMEELPFPLICHSSIINYATYGHYKEAARSAVGTVNRDRADDERGSLEQTAVKHRMARLD